ncbi:MAG: NAD(P)/FAD-dependent oxidoreductase [Fidelibacterota bacterium]
MIFDLIILGAGVVGISTARYFSETYSDWNILLVEKNTRHGHGISSRNSEVIHAGIYYPKEWLKSQLCIAGRRQLYTFLEKYHIPYKKTGKVIVAVNESQSVELYELYTRARNKDIEGLAILDSKQVSTMIPHIDCLSGLYSPESGILSVSRYMDVLLNLFQSKNGAYLPNTIFAGLDVKNELMEICLTSKRDGTEKVLTKRAINATGLSAHSTAVIAGFKNVPNVHFCKGHYYRVAGARNLFKKLVYPLPDNSFLGIHVTPDLSGEVKLGPDARYLKENVENYGEFLTSETTFINDVKRYWPNVTDFKIESAMTGIRPKLYHQHEKAKDFMICDESTSGCPNWINLYGIESPGITASLAFGPYIDNRFFCS